jgi:hypothetical protein
MDDRDFRLRVVTALEESCAICRTTLRVAQHRERFVERLDGLVCLLRRDKRCPDEDCSGRARIYRPFEDARFALPRMTFGTDVVIAVGERHFDRHESLQQIGLSLNEQGIPIHQTHVGELFRYYLALSQLARGDDAALCARLRKRGGIVLMIDGVQFDEHSPVLYLVWDALSGEPLFGERRAFKGADDLRSLLLRVKAMEVPVIGIASDKEKGLVPAVAEVFPEVPYQFCQTHFLKNCAKPLAEDLSTLSNSVAERAENVRKISKRLHVDDLVEAEVASVPVLPVRPISEQAGPISEHDLVTELCAITRENARASGKAPLGPPELSRHNRLEVIREAVEVARQSAREGGLSGHRQSVRSSPRRARRGSHA